MSVQPKLIISVIEARKLLGKDADTLGDEEIEELIITLTGIASTFLRKPLVPKNKQRQRFQSLIFKEGLILNTTTMEFGTTKISPLYRYAPNKKDLSAKEKSLVVSSLDKRWNTIYPSLVSMYQKLEALDVMNYSDRAK